MVIVNKNGKIYYSAPDMKETQYFTLYNNETSVKYYIIDEENARVYKISAHIKEDSEDASLIEDSRELVADAKAEDKGWKDEDLVQENDISNRIIEYYFTYVFSQSHYLLKRLLENNCLSNSNNIFGSTYATSSFYIRINKMNYLAHKNRLDVLEKLVIAYGSNIVNLLENESFVFNVEQKIDKVLELSPKVRMFTEEINSSNSIYYYSASNIVPLLQKMNNSDPNGTIVFVDFLRNRPKYGLSLRKIPSYWSINRFICQFDAIIDMIKNFKIAKILNYLLYQCLVKEGDISIDIINNVASTYEDYLNVIKDLPNADFYPAYLFKAESIATKNVTGINLDEQEQEQFKVFNEENKRYEYANSDYILMLPKSPYELFIEGNVLQHCVATYARHIAYGKKLVAFLRKASEPDVPYITVEIDLATGCYIQIKEHFNNDVVDADVLRFLSVAQKNAAKNIAA